MSKNNAGLLIATCLLMTACAGTPQTARLADGSIAIRVECDGSASGLNRCFERAGKSCGAAGYTIVDARGETIAPSRVGNAAMENIIKEYEMDQNSMLIKCNK